MSKNPATKKTDTVWSPMVKIVALLCAIVLIVTIVVAIVAKNGVFRRNTTVMEVGEHKISLLEFEYYYNTIYSNYASYYGLTSVDIKTTNCYMDTSMTWHEFLVNETKEQIAEIYVLSDKAKAEGFSMTEESQKSIDETVATVESSAETAKLSVDEYLSSYYCKNLTKDEFIEFNTRTMLASDYTTHYTDSLEITSEEIEAYYNEHTKEYQAVDYYSFELIEVDGVSVETRAEEIKALTSLDDFLAVLKVVRAGDLESDIATDDGTSTDAAASDTTSSGDSAQDETTDTGTEEDAGTSGDATASEEPKELDMNDYLVEGDSYVEGEEMSEWLFNEETAIGSINVFKSTTTSGSDTISLYTAVYLVAREKDDSEVASMRHFLVQADEKLDEEKNVVTDEEGNTVLEMDTAREEINKIKAQYDAAINENSTLAEKEEAFKKLFTDDQQTDDTSSQSTGGLYEEFESGYMTENINNRFFPEDVTTRIQPGTCEIIETDYGCHLVLALEYSNSVEASIKATLKNDKFTSFVDGLKADAGIVYNQKNLAKVG